MPRTSRRSFLAATAAGLTLITTNKTFSQEAAAKKLRVAFVGVGGKGTQNLERVSMHTTVAALCDVDENTLNNAAKKHPDAAKLFDYRGLFQKPDTFDAVVVTVPDHMHAPIAMAAINAGKHVYCEKPMTHDIIEARKLTQAAAAKGVRTQMGNAGHSSDGTRLTVEWIRAGAVGTVKEIHVWSDRPKNWWPQGFGQPALAGSPPRHLHWDLLTGSAPEMPYYIDEKGASMIHPFKWRGWWPLGTGALGDMGCHIFNVSFWACELAKASTITVECEQEGATDFSGPNWSIITYKFSGENFSPITMKWYDGGKQPPRPAELEADREWGKITNGTIFVGDKATMLAPHAASAAPRLIPETKMKDFKRPEPYLPRIPGGGNGHHKDWIDAILQDRPAGTDFVTHSGALTEIVLIGNVALRAKKKITFDRPNLKLDDATLDKYLKREYRRGYTL
jgi:predicted dehydrogenase